MALVNLVRAASATTGTGTLTLGSPVVGFLDMASAGAINGATYTYAIEGNYIAAGDEFVASAREIGRGVWDSSANTLTRNVLKSTNSNALLNLTGDEQVIITLAAEDIKEYLGANRTYYVRAGGNDSNAGLANNDASAFKTFQGAYNAVKAAINSNGYNVTIIAGVASQAWTDTLFLNSEISGGGSVVFDWNSGSLTAPAGTNCIDTNYFTTQTVTFQNVAFAASGGGGHITFDGNGIFILGPGITFGACSSGANMILSGSVVIKNWYAYTLSASCAYHVLMQSNASLFNSLGSVTNIVNLGLTIDYFNVSIKGGFIDVGAHYTDQNGKSRQTTTGNTHSNTTLDNLAVNTSNLSVGMVIVGSGIPAGTTISSISTSSSLVMSNAASSSLTGTSIKFELCRGIKYLCGTNGIINTYGAGVDYLPGDTAGTPATPGVSGSDGGIYQ